MKPNQRFLKQPKHFWANVRSISQRLGYTDRRTERIKVPRLADMKHALEDLGLRTVRLVDENQDPTALGKNLVAYFQYRAEVLNGMVRRSLMDVARARRVFERLKARLSPQCPLPMNKQKGSKKARAYFTGIVNMLIEANSEGLPAITTRTNSQQLP